MAVEDLPIGKRARAETLGHHLDYACEAAYDVESEEEYGLLRKEFLLDPEVSDLVPDVIRDHPSLRDTYEYLRSKFPLARDRRKYMREALRPMMAKLKESRSRALLPGEDPRIELNRLAGAATTRAAASASSSTWTGRASTVEKARQVLTLAPAAIEGVRALLDQHERRLHNGPPEALNAGELDALRDLHTALGALLAACDGKQSLEAQLDKVAGLTERIFHFASDTGELCVAGLKPLLASAPAAWGTWTLLGLICNPTTFAALGPTAAAAVTAGYFGLEVKGRKSRKK